MDNVYISRREYDEHSKRMEDEHRRMNHRIAELEEREKENNKLLALNAVRPLWDFHSRLKTKPLRPNKLHINAR